MKIKIETIVHAGMEKVWAYWTEPAHIMKWAFAADDWMCPHAENDLKVGGTFLTRMVAKDGSASFDIVGTYTEVDQYKKIAYVFAERVVIAQFEKIDENTTKITQEFDPEHENPEEFQKKGWQGILDNFKKHVETE